MKNLHTNNFGITERVYDISKHMTPPVIKLSDYIRRVMRDKDLNLPDVQRNSRGMISFAYVNDLIQEKTLNPTVLKLKALAVGLGISEEELFRVARGLPLEHSDEYNARASRLLEVFYALPDIAQLEYLSIGEALLAFHSSLRKESKESGKIHNPMSPPQRAVVPDMKPKLTEKEKQLAREAARRLKSKTNDEILEDAKKRKKDSKLRIKTKKASGE